MSEHEPNLDLVSQIRGEYEQLRDRRELLGPHTAIEMLSFYEGAEPFFEIGIRLGRETSPESQALAAEMKKYIGDRRQQLHDAVIPKGGTGSRKSGG